MNQYDREEDQLISDLNSGLISVAEFNKQMRELQRDYRADAEEAAERAYNEELGRW